MKQSNKNANAPQTLKGQPLPTTQDAPTPTVVQETDEARQARVNRANQAIREVLTKETCILMVPNLDISSGRVFPQIQVVAQPLQAKP